VSTTLPHKEEPTQRDGVSSQPSDQTPEGESTNGQEAEPGEVPSSEPQSNAPEDA
jgi:hypothetical protein